MYIPSVDTFNNYFEQRSVNLQYINSIIDETFALNFYSLYLYRNKLNLNKVNASVMCYFVKYGYTSGAVQKMRKSLLKVY